MKMFNKLQAIIHNAVDALAPELPPQVTFVFHWKAITNYFIEATDEKVPVQGTSIPSHLDDMITILREEEEKASGGTMGPCLEYLLQHKILETLHTLGRADCPPGMKQQVLKFFANLLAKIKQPLLPHINVYRPVHRLIRICGEVRAAPTENEEIQFLCTVCAKLRQDPYLVNFFLEVPGSSGMRTPSRDTPPSTPGEDEMDKPKEPEKPEYTLVNSLLTFTKSEDSRVAVKACEGLLLCASLPEDHAATVIILYTAFCEVMADRLKALFEALPRDIDPVDISTVVAKWGLDHQSDDEDVSAFPGKRQLISFLSWLDYIDNLCKESHKLVAKALAVGVRERFLQAVVEPSLVQPSEPGVIMTTAVLTRSVRLISSPHILNELCSFLLGERTEPELPSHEGEHKLCQTLIERCDHLSDELSIETLKLFEALIHKPCDMVLNILILRNLAGRKYYVAPVVTNGDITTETKEGGTTLNGPTNENQSPPLSPFGTGSPPGTPDIEKTFTNPDAEDDADQRSLEKIINSFLLLVPDEVKSSVQAGDTGYDTYLKDAHKQFNERIIQSLHFHWPKTAVASKDDTRDSFYQGSFLSMLFRKLQRILDQPYDVNLHVTSVVSALAQFQHPQLHEFLLDVTIPLSPDCPSLYSTLENVVQDLKGRTQRIPNFQKNVVGVRKQLMGVATSPEHKSTTQSNLFEAVIVLEEFCKELAAIAFVKATARLHNR